MSLSRNTRRSALFIAALGVVTVGNGVAVQAASGTWSAAPVDANWPNASNWVDGIVPGDTASTTNPDVATFSATSSPTVTVDANRNLGGLVFNSTAAYNLSGGNLLLSNGGLIQATSGLTSSGSTGLTATINTPIALQGNGATYTFESNAGGSALLNIIGTVAGTSSAGSVTTLNLIGSGNGQNLASGAVSDGTNGGKLAVIKSGTGTWNLTGTSNTYSGGTTVSGGTLRTPTAGNTTALFGTGTITVQNNATLRLGNTGTTTINNDLVIGAGGGYLSFRGGGTFSPASLTGTGDLTITTEQATGTITPTTFRNFAGTVNLTNTAATPTGGTILRLATAFDNTSLANTTLNLSANTTVSRQAGTNQPNSPANTVSVGGLSGTGGFFGASGAGGGNFIYNIGSNDKSTTYAGVIGNGGSITSIGKIGVGTLTLTGANSYTGGTVLTAGTLNINGINALGGANYGLFTTNAALRFNGGTLQYATALTSSGDISTNPGTNTASNVTFTTTAVIDTNGNAVTYANPVGNAGAGGLTKIGAGTLTLAGANTYTGTTTVSAGTLRATNAAYTPILSNGGADVQGSGRLVLDYTGTTSPVAQVKSILDGGYAGKFATGQIRSSTLAANRTIGYGDNGTSEVTVLVTLPGDANLNGTVDFNDFLVLQNSFGKADTRFDQGNFNYDGLTDFNDFLVLQNNFGQSINGSAVAITSEQVAALTAFANNPANVAVPEPTSLAVLGLAAAGLMSRRRSR